VRREEEPAAKRCPAPERPAAPETTRRPERRTGERPFASADARDGVRAVFLDRDGVINDQTAFVNAPDDLCLLPGAAGAIRRLNEAGIPVVVVTNQGGIAMGHLTEETLAAIHRRMDELLAAEGARVDAVYYCPHYPGATTGKPLVEGSSALRATDFDPRRRSPEAAPDCPCRKPGTGMLEKARDELGIDLSVSVLVGDATTDILAGLRAGCTTILVRTGLAGRDGKADARPDHTVDDLPAAVDLILSELRG